MRLALLLTVAAAASPPAVEAPTGRATVVQRPLAAMVPIRGGSFMMGASTELQSAALELCREEIGTRNRVACVRDVVESEGPQRKVYLSPFAIDRVEVTVAAWRDLRAGRRLLAGAAGDRRRALLCGRACRSRR